MVANRPRKSRRERSQREKAGTEREKRIPRSTRQNTSAKKEELSRLKIVSWNTRKRKVSTIADIVGIIKAKFGNTSTYVAMQEVPRWAKQNGKQIHGWTYHTDVGCDFGIFIPQAEVLGTKKPSIRRLLVWYSGPQYRLYFSPC